ncbi:4Fe-4S binding protein [candidate division WOR-3 bacterium]|nr:4Fe-4S binding protein [candidate division WOR-3 bacterium]
MIRSHRRAYRVTIDRNKCIGCLLCVKNCPTEALLERIRETFPAPFLYYPEKCSGCLICEENCPVKAITVDPITPEVLSRGSWTSDVVETIHLKAETGEYALRGYGSSRPLPTLDDIIVVPAQLSKTPVDKYRQECNTKVVIGKGRVKKPLALDIPIVLGAMSYGAISKNAKMALAKGTAQAGSAANTGEGGSFPEERKLAKNLIVQWSTGRFGCNTHYLKTADAIEIKVGQGAKPGMGGHLMADKVTPEIAKVRGIPVGTDVLSPCRHLDMTRPGDLDKHVELLREVTDWQIPIIIKLGPGNIYNDVKFAIEAEPDAIAIDGMEGGTGASPEITTEHAGIPTLGCIVPAVKALEDSGHKDKIKLMLLGGIKTGADTVKAIAMGFDIVGIASAALIALGCRVCKQCNTGKCVYGIATQDPDLSLRLDINEGARRIANFLAVMTGELKILTMLAGYDDIYKLTKDDLRTLNRGAADITGIKLIGAEDIP